MTFIYQKPSIFGTHNTYLPIEWVTCFQSFDRRNIYFNFSHYITLSSISSRSPGPSKKSILFVFFSRNLRTFLTIHRPKQKVPPLSKYWIYKSWNDEFTRARSPRSPSNNLYVYLSVVDFSWLSLRHKILLRVNWEYMWL